MNFSIYFQGHISRDCPKKPEGGFRGSRGGGGGRGSGGRGGFGDRGN